jgi:hypothetical protein
MLYENWFVWPYVKGWKGMEGGRDLNRQGGLDQCSLAHYKAGNLTDTMFGEWDNRRLEGPAFVWYFRGEPHVPVWVNVANDPSVALNARG